MTKIETVDAPSQAVSANRLKTLIEAGKPASLLDVVVTPELAKVMLSYNREGETNRKLKKFYVNEQVTVLKQGRWINTGEPVIFSNDAILNDGQHRLETIIAAGVACIMDLRFGVARRAFIATNTGHKRSGADALHLAGFHKSNTTAAITRLAHAYRLGLPGSLRLRMPNDLTVTLTENDPVFIEAAKLVGTLPKSLRNAAMGTTLYFALKSANEGAVKEFSEVLREGGGSPSNPPHRLRELCLTGRLSQHGSDTRMVLLACGIQAWNAYKTGDKIGRWWKQGEEFPKVVGLRG